MAPHKRSIREPGEDADLELSRASGLQPDYHRKKVRLSTENDDSRYHRDRSPSSSDEEMGEQDTLESNIQPSTQYEILRDGDFEYLNNQDLDDQLATQRILARGQIGDNHPADNAIIEEVTCINFMCHDKFHVVLGPLINFIVGWNGSGKSAVMTAITLCLGGKASSTNRGSSLKSLIKAGRDQAILIVQLKNQGPDAYQPDLYGKSIIVERHFTKSGASGFKLKNAAGRVVSTKKGDLEDIIEYFQMQVDNPMNNLNQDAAKSFITASTPSQKYQFFVKGVQLEQLDNDYRLVSETCDKIDAKLFDAKEDIKALAKNAEQAKAKWKIAQQHEGLRKAAKSYVKQAAWSQVEEQEKLLEEREQGVNEAQRNIERAQAEIDAKDQVYQHTNSAVEHALEVIRTLEEEALPLEAAETESKAACDAKRLEVQRAVSERNDISAHLTEARNRRQKFINEIASVEKKIEDINGGAHTRRLADLEDAKERAKAAKEALDNHVKELPALQKSQQAASDDLRKVEGPIAAKRNELSSAENRLKNLKSDRGDVMAGYDSRIPQLLKLIRNSNEFQEKPVGPVGLHIKLLKPIWSNVIETALSRMTSAFIVTSKSDSVRLQKMASQIGLNDLNIVIGNNQPLDVTGHEPDPHHDTILRVLEIDNDSVRRQLIIGQNIEQTLLIENSQDAYRVIEAGAKDMDIGRNRNEDIGPVKPLGREPRLKTNIESQISLQKDVIDQLHGELKELEASKVKLQQNLRQCEQAIRQHRQVHNQLNIKSQEADDLVDRRQAELEDNTVSDGRLVGLKNLLAEAEKDNAIYEESYVNATLERDKLNEASLALKRDHDARKEQLADHLAKIQKAKQKHTNRQQARSIALQEKNAAISAFEDLKTAKAYAEQKRERQAARVAEFTASASQICERVPIDEGETAASIDKKLSSLKAQIASYSKKLGGTDQELSAAYEKAERAYQTAEAHYKNLVELQGLLKFSFLERMSQWRRFQRSISASARMNFNYLLSERAFRGKLMIDHKNKTLDVHVEPDETTKSGKGRMAKTLSGGEKSFSSICLLLALWEAMGAPLRCLDEYDVFMDDVNRDISTKMIITGARRQVGRQFILITPKALGAGIAEGEPDVKTIVLRDPRQRRVDDMMEGNE
ncbi:dna repair protein-like protein rad18 [Xylogone sp. PMI_703]|nr:dna repair protein-like protein rad18 [Xylogone sp. PMI_703]